MIEITLGMAEKAAKAAQAKARSLGTHVTVSVVDEAGRLVYTARGDGTGFFTPETSRAKAVLAAAFRRPTKEMVGEYSSSPAFWASLPALLFGQVLPSMGGVPIVVGGRLIGAVGCGGSTAEHDHECAVAGADALASTSDP